MNFKPIRDKLIFYSPKIAKGIGVGGMFASGYFFCEGLTESKELIKKRKEELETDKLGFKETVKTTWKCFIKAGACGATSGLLIFLGEKKESERAAALATVCSMSETAFEKYSKAVAEEIGEKKEKEIRDKVKKETLDENPVSKTTVVFAGRGDVLFFDEYARQYYYSDVETVRHTYNDINDRMFDEFTISINEYIDQFNDNGIPLRRVEYGDQLGWNRDYVRKLEPDFSFHMSDDNRPCVHVSAWIGPKSDYKPRFGDM